MIHSLMLAVVLFAGPAPDRAFYATPLQPCEVCGCTNMVQRHHTLPQHIAREIGTNALWTIYSASNIHFLCECQAHLHHLLWGHRGSFRDQNDQLDRMLKIQKRLNEKVGK